MPNQRGIIFNVGASDVIQQTGLTTKTAEIYIFEILQISCVDNAIVAGSAATKSVKGSVKKLFNAGASTSSSTSSIDERTPLLEHDPPNSGPVTNSTANRRSSSNRIWRFFVSLFYSFCPCVGEGSIIVPVSEYPVDLDAKLAKAFVHLYKSLDEDWYQKLIEVRRSKHMTIKQLQHTKEERVENEYRRLVGINSDLSSTAANRFLAFANVREFIRVETENITHEFERKTDQLCMEHYDVVVEEQFEMLISFWRKIRLSPNSC